MDESSRREPNFTVSLRFGEGAIQVEELERELGLKARNFWKAGEPRRTPKGTSIPGAPSSVNFATFNLPSPAEKLSEALVQFIPMLEGHSELFKRVKESGGTIQLFVGWFIENNVMDYFEADLLGRLAALGIDLYMDVYEGGRHSRPRASVT
jgi:hypothetical protein